MPHGTLTLVCFDTTKLQSIVPYKRTVRRDCSTTLKSWQCLSDCEMLEIGSCDCDAVCLHASYREAVQIRVYVFLLLCFIDIIHSSHTCFIVVSLVVNWVLAWLMWRFVYLWVAEVTNRQISWPNPMNQPKVLTSLLPKQSFILRCIRHYSCSSTTFSEILFSAILPFG